MSPTPSTLDDNNKSEVRETDLTSHQNQSIQTVVGRHQLTSNHEGPNIVQYLKTSTTSSNQGYSIGCSNVQSDTLESKKSVEKKRTVQEALNPTNALTKSIKASTTLQQSVQTSRYGPQYGTTTENTAGQFAKTWPDLRQIEQQERGSKRDKTSLDLQNADERAEALH